MALRTPKNMKSLDPVSWRCFEAYEDEAELSEVFELLQISFTLNTSTKIGCSVHMGKAASGQIYGTGAVHWCH